MSNGLAVRVVVALFLLLAAGFGGLAIRTAFTQSELGERTRAVETRQGATEEAMRDLKTKVDVIYAWVLRQQGAAERGRGGWP